MKIRLDYFFLKLVKQNILYIISILVVSLSIFFSIYFLLKQYQQQGIKKNDLISQLEQLKKKKALIELKDHLTYEGIDVDELNKVFNQLLPESEDFFSVVVALEKISSQTGFIISDYQINLGQITNNKISITITGHGDKNTFMNFIKDYNYIGGRLITLDNIDFSEKGFSDTRLTLNFYSQKNITNPNIKEIKLSEEDKSRIKLIKNKIKFEFVSEEASQSGYPTKKNPF